MKNKITRCISFAVILFLILLILSHVFIPKNNLKEFGMRDVKANGVRGEKENTIDILVAGDSISYASMIPLEWWKEYGYTAYNIGTAAQVLPDTIEMVYNATKSQNPKILLLETDTIYCDSDINMFVKKIATQILPVLDYHDRWKSLNSNDWFGSVNYTWTDDLKGYEYCLDTCAYTGGEYMIETKKKELISKSNKMYLRILNEYCKSRNIELVFVSVPNAKYWNYKRHNAVQEFADSEGIEYIDLNLKKDEVQIDWSADTRDQGDHLNHYGALKVTKYLGEYLQSKNILQDHREDENYSKWNESLERYLLGEV